MGTLIAVLGVAWKVAVSVVPVVLTWTGYKAQGNARRAFLLGLAELAWRAVEARKKSPAGTGLKALDAFFLELGALCGKAKQPTPNRAEVEWLSKWAELRSVAAKWKS